MPRGSGDSDTGRRYGYRQGPQPDDDRRKQFGRWANMGGRSWDWQIGPDGNVQWRARAGNPGRVEAYGSDWFNAPDYVQRGYDRSSAYFGKNPDASFEDFQVQRGLQSQIAREGLVQDPATGNWYHPQQGAFDPNGYYRDAQGYVSGQGGAGGGTGGTGGVDGGGTGGAGASGTGGSTILGMPPWEDHKPIDPGDIKSSAGPANFGAGVMGTLGGSAPFKKRKQPFGERYVEPPADPYVKPGVPYVEPPADPYIPAKSSPSSFSDRFMGSSGFGTGSAPAKSAPAGSSNFQSGLMNTAGDFGSMTTKKRKRGEPFNPFGEGA